SAPTSRREMLLADEHRVRGGAAGGEGGGDQAGGVGDEQCHIGGASLGLDAAGGVGAAIAGGCCDSAIHQSQPLRQVAGHGVGRVRCFRHDVMLLLSNLLRAANRQRWRERLGLLRGGGGTPGWLGMWQVRGLRATQASVLYTGGPFAATCAPGVLPMRNGLFEAGPSWP